MGEAGDFEFEQGTAKQLGPMGSADLRAMAGLGISALPMFLCKVPNSQFHRDQVARRFEEEQTKAGEEVPNRLFPTATAHGLLALLDVGAYSSRDVRRGAPLESSSGPGEARAKWSSSTHGQIELPKDKDGAFTLPFIHDFLERYVRGDDSDPSWFLKAIYKASSHASKEEDGSSGLSDPPNRSELILLGHVVPALVFGCDYVVRFYSEEVFDAHVRGTIARCFSGLGSTIPAIERLLGYSDGDPSHRDLDADHCWSHIGKLNRAPNPTDNFDPGIPTYLLVNATFAVCALLGLLNDVKKTIASRGEPVSAPSGSEGSELLSDEERAEADQARRESEDARNKLIGELDTHFGEAPVKSLERLQKDLALAIRRRLERLMAIRGIPDDPLFDPVGLTFVVRAMCLLDPDFRQNPLFREAIETIVECQLDDGCWPDGAATNSRHGTATLQPSVEVAYALAASVHTRDARHGPTAAEVVAMKIALPALQRHARYLELAFLDNARGEGRGWSNDRARHSSNPELWTTALAVRFLHFAALINDAVNRAEVLTKYDSSLITRTRRPNANEPKSPTVLFYDGLIQPEEITKPVDEIHERFIKPIEKKMIERRYITRPARDGVSFLLFGPPRSGKTFLVESLAKALRWPLLSLDPGNFVPRAGESVGAMMSRVFDDLKQLHDVVVLFDECDELLISREQEFADVRMPLITSALLTRLTSLKDQRGPIFCFATNYYHRVDTAARGVGRFDAVLMFDRPHESARERIIEKVWIHVHKEHRGALGDAGIEKLPNGLVEDLAKRLGGCAYLEIRSAVIEVGLLLFGDRGILSRVPKAEQAEHLDQQLSNGNSQLHKDITRVIERNTPSREDYYRWCAGDGKKDLNACDGGGFSASAKNDLITVWKEAAGLSGVTGLDWTWPI